MTIIEEINRAYSEYITARRTAPNIAMVKVQWNDNEYPEDAVQEICIGDYDESVPSNIKDDDILFYCSNVMGLLNLTCEDNGEDFVVKEFIGFDYVE